MLNISNSDSVCSVNRHGLSGISCTPDVDHRRCKHTSHHHTFGLVISSTEIGRHPQAIRQKNQVGRYSAFACQHSGVATSIAGVDEENAVDRAQPAQVPATRLKLSS